MFELRSTSTLNPIYYIGNVRVTRGGVVHGWGFCEVGVDECAEVTTTSWWMSDFSFKVWVLSTYTNFY